MKFLTPLSIIKDCANFDINYFFKCEIEAHTLIAFDHII